MIISSALLSFCIYHSGSHRWPVVLGRVSFVHSLRVQRALVLAHSPPPRECRPALVAPSCPPPLQHLLLLLLLHESHDLSACRLYGVHINVSCNVAKLLVFLRQHVMHPCHTEAAKHGSLLSVLLYVVRGGL